MRRYAALGLALVACMERPPPPGSGALETTPTGSVTRPPTAGMVSLPQALPYPNGSVLTTDPKACRIALLRDGTSRWDLEIAGCNGFLEATIAMDSVVYVRDPKQLSSIAPDGTLQWTAKLGDPPLPRAIATPTALADSRVAIAATSKNLVVYDRDGKVSWSFSPPSDEVLVAAPVGMKTEGIILLSTQAVYYLGAGGEIRWRAASPNHTAQR
jgi:hypothetical protein